LETSSERLVSKSLRGHRACGEYGISFSFVAFGAGPPGLPDFEFAYKLTPIA
jgi:hypothetical protein